MKVLKLLSLVAVLAVASMLTGCAAFSITHPGGQGNSAPIGVSSGMLVGNVTYPNLVQSSTRFDLDTDDFEIIGPVVAHGTSFNVLGIVGMGDNGYGRLYAAAQRMGAHDVINVKVDTKVTRVLIGVYTQSTIKMNGIGIKYKDK